MSDSPGMVASRSISKASIFQFSGAGFLLDRFFATVRFRLPVATFGSMLFSAVIW